MSQPRGGSGRSGGSGRGGGSSRGGSGRSGGSGKGQQRRSNTRGEQARGANRSSGSGRGRGSRGASSGQRGTTPIRGGGGAGTRRKPLGGDQVEGRQAVRELLFAGRRRAREIVFAADLDPALILDEIQQLANDDRIPIREVSRGKFDAMTATDSAQGVMAMAPPLVEHDLDDLMASHNGEPPFLLVVDGVTDPGNLGAMLRVAETAGVTGVVLPGHRSARISPSVAKSAAGAIEHLRIAQVTGIPSALADMAKASVWTVGLDMGSEQSVFDLRVATDPVALVLGAEGKGLSRLVRERCDLIASIPMAGRLDSLNVATASAVGCFEVRRRRLSEP